MYSWIGWLTESPLRRTCLFGWLRWLSRKHRRPFFLFVGSCIAALPIPLNRTIRKNYQVAMNVQRTDQIQQFIADYWSNVSETWFELGIEVPATGVDWDRIRCMGMQHIDEALRQGHGAIVYAPHQGNFFFAYAYLSERYDCLTVATASDKSLAPLYQNFTNRGYRGLDYDLTPPLKLVYSLQNHLQNNGVVFLLGDFYRPEFNQTLLFGLPNRSPIGAYKLSARTGAPVLPMQMVREPNGYHRFRIAHPFLLDADATADEQLQKMVNWLEQRIIEHPEQWFYWFQLDQRWHHT